MVVNYNDQARNNMICLFEDIEYLERRQAFFKIIKSFSEKGIDWAIGCSLNLFLRGIVDDFHDFDLIVDIKSIPDVKEVMKGFGAKLVETGGNGYCESDVYMHYQFERVDVDIISGFRVNTYGTSYLYKYNASENDVIEIEDLKVPVIPLEAMYVLYYMMEGWQPRRKFKRMLISEYFKTEHLRHKIVLNTAIKDYNLPNWIRWDIKELI